MDDRLLNRYFVQDTKFDFSDVLIQPRYSSIRSRNDVNRLIFDLFIYLFSMRDPEFNNRSFRYVSKRITSLLLQ